MSCSIDRRFAARLAAVLLSLGILPGSLAVSFAATEGSATCKLFSVAEVSKALGKPAAAGLYDAAKAENGCEWKAESGKGHVTILIMARGQWFDSVGGQDQRPFSGVGEKAYIGPSGLGGIQAGAIAGDHFYLVLIDPPAADSVARDLLKTFIARSQ